MARLALALLLLSHAQASVFDAYGFGARAGSMAGAHTAAAEDYTATWYNPGALTWHKVPHVGTGLNVVVPRLSIDHEADAAEGAAGDALPDTTVGVNLGLLFPLGGLLENRFALGVGAYLPTTHVVRIETPDPQTPHFYRYDALTDKVALAIGGAFEPHEMISLGLAWQVLGSLDGNARVELDLLTQRFTRKEVQVDVHADSGIIAGVHLRPVKGLRLGFSFRDSLQVEYDLVTDIVIRGVGSLVADVRGTALFTPQQYTWGAAWEPIETLTLSFDLMWARWSEAPDPSARFKVTLDGERLGLGTVEADAAAIDLGAEDTLEPKAGVEWRATESLALRAGYAMRPTPLPAQTGYGNYIDSDAHQLALGVGYSFPDPLAMHDAPITLDLTSQLTFVGERGVEKTDEADEIGDYSAGGRVWNLALTFRHDFY